MADYQCDRGACQCWVNGSLGRANTREELEKKAATFKVKDSAEALQEWYKKSARAVENEINLSLLQNKVQLKYVPVPSIRTNQVPGCD
jgi:hypothetical protein